MTKAVHHWPAIALRFVFLERGALSVLIAAGAGAVLEHHWPFPQHNLLLALIQLRTPAIYDGLHVAYTLLLFTTPFVIASAVLSTGYIFFYRPDSREITPVLPPYPDYRQAPDPALVIGELHNPRQPAPVARPRWLTIPARGLHTGIAVFGAVGSGKTSGAILPFLRQLIEYQGASARSAAGSSPESIGGLVLEVKGDLSAHVRRLMRGAGRGADYVEVGFSSAYRYNPLHNDLDAYALAYGMASLMNNLFGKGKEPFWQQAYTNMVKFIILLHKVLYDYVTLFDVYECAISPGLLANRLDEAEQLFSRAAFIEVPKANPKILLVPDIERFGFELDATQGVLRAHSTSELKQVIVEHGIEDAVELVPKPFTPEQDYKRRQFEAVRRWFQNDWLAMDHKLRTSIVEGISVFLSLFDDNPEVKRLFCPPKDLYRGLPVADDPDGIPLPPFAELIERGVVCALNFPVVLNPGLAKAIGTMMKLDYQRAVLLRIPEMERHPERRFRDALFICDEYQHFATVGGNDPNGDEKFFSLSRQAKCIPIIATQSISSIKEALSGDGWRTLLQTFRTKIFLAQSDEFSVQTAAALCGKQDRLKVGYSVSEAASDARVSLLTGKTLANKGSVTAAKNYSVQKDFIFDERSFTLLRNAQAIVVPFDGVNQREPTYCYLKPWFLDRNKSYWAQLRDQEI